MSRLHQPAPVNGSSPAAATGPRSAGQPSERGPVQPAEPVAAPAREAGPDRGAVFTAGLPAEERAGGARARAVREPEFEPPPRRERSQALKRSEVYTRPVVDGRELSEHGLTRARNRLRALFSSRLEREEALLEAELAELPGLTRTNTVAVISPKGGVGKTTCTFVVGNLLASQLKLRVLCVDANVDFGTLAALAPDRVRAERSLADLLNDMDELHSAAELHPYVSRLPTGLHLLGAPPEAEVMAQITPTDYGELLAFLGQWYEVIVLDLGTGIAGEWAQFALGRADQTVIVTTPEWVTATNVSGALRHLRRERATLVMNKSRTKGSGDSAAIEGHFRKAELSKRVVVPYDDQLLTMLDSGTYSLGGLARATRVPVKRLGLAVAEHLQ